MKVVVLRGGAPVRRRRPATDSTADRGVMAIGSDDGAWALVNMSPAVAHQLDTDPRLPADLVDAASRVVVLTDAQVDHVGGLLSLRHGAPIELYATPTVFEELTGALPILPVLQHYCSVHWHVVPVAGDARAATFRIDTMPQLEFTALATQAPPPPHSPGAAQPRIGDAIALAVRDLASGQRLFCAPGATQFGALEFDWMRTADCLLVDGPALAVDAELPWIDLLRDLPARHKVLFSSRAAGHDEHALADRGIALAYDGLEIEL